MKVGIIGSGVAGIATSIRLAHEGHQVEIFEANNYPGGKLTTVQLGDYLFDAGPSLFTMPENIIDLFNLTNRKAEDYFRYKVLDTTCHYFYEDGTVLEGKTNIDKFATEINNKLGSNTQVISNHLNKSKEIYELTSFLFMEKSLHKLKTYTDPRVFKTLFNIGKLDLNKTMNEVNEKSLKHPKLVQLFNRFATYNGSSPYLAPAVLNIIPHLEHNQGTFFPIGGMRSIPQSLFKLSQELGVKYHFNSRIEEIITSKRSVKGIRTEDEEFDFDRVVSNMDIFPTYRKLLPNEKAPEKILRQPRSSSALIFYWGIQKTFDQLDLHNIFFSENYKEEFEQIFEKKDIYHDPTIYVNISSKHNPSDAPKGCENWFVMINVPHNEDHDWDTLIKESRKNIITKLSRLLNTDISSLIKVEDILDPRLIEQRTSSYQGALYGSSSNNKMAALLRHKNFSSTIKGLYFCGGSVHPGGGIPLCLFSAKIVAENFK